MNQVQGFCRYLGTTIARWSWCEVLQGGSHCHPRGHHLSQTFYHPCVERLMGAKDRQAPTVPCKVTGRCGSVLVCLIPASRGTGIVSAPASKQRLPLSSLYDCSTSARSCTAILGKEATFDAISKTCSHLTTDLWKETVFLKSPY